jgi:hypothetical protein
MSTQNLITQTRARFNANYQKIQLVEKYEAKLIFAFENGLWKADASLIGTLNSFQESTIVLLDMYKTPIKVNRVELLSKAKQIYVETTNQWYVEYQSITN